tara:strand:+ start:2819 stop:3943 length:1125 start_codon:yes stop_codon:yes gene_type:complete
LQRRIEIKALLKDAKGLKIIMKEILLTGDTPTGKLHLGHYVGSLESRLRLQDEYDCFFIIANMHAFTTNITNPELIRKSVLDITLDYLSVGLDPDKSTIFLQSEIPAIADLTFYFSMLISHSRLMRNPTIKSEIQDKGLGDKYPFGFLLYPIGQIADILAFRANIVPVGEDQLPHLELANEVVRKFNNLYCGVNLTEDNQDIDYVSLGGLFPHVKPLVGRIKRLVGITGPDGNGNLLKMSKSLNNSILLSDDADTVSKKIMKMYTDPNRLRATDPGTVENNPLWIFHDAFNHDKSWVEDAKEQYRKGQTGDVVCKKKLVDVINDLLEPIRQKRKHYENNEDLLINVLKQGSDKANEVAENTLKSVKESVKQFYF